MKTTIFLALFMTILSTSATAETVKSEVTVSFAELNLQNEAGVRILYTRLVEASKTACGANINYSLISTSMNHQDRRNCVAGSLSRAVSQIGNERLTEIHQSS
tara:strand:- start:13241 stop:13549 length:309 start_codon:yes stop_codon:yes gene_type:complete